MPELRLETVFPEERHDEVVAALRGRTPTRSRPSTCTRCCEGALSTDGGARGNPGPAAYGYVLEAEDGTVLAARGEPIGVATNNVAEYRALIAGLEKALELGVPELEVVSDSELMVKQMRGEYRVKNEALRELSLEAARLARKLGRSSTGRCAASTTSSPTASSTRRSTAPETSCVNLQQHARSSGVVRLWRSRAPPGGSRSRRGAWHEPSRARRDRGR